MLLVFGQEWLAVLIQNILAGSMGLITYVEQSGKQCSPATDMLKPQHMPYLHLISEISLLLRQSFVINESILLPELVCAELATQVFESRIAAVSANRPQKDELFATDVSSGTDNLLIPKLRCF